MVPQIKAALYEIYTRHKQINKQANNQPHTKTHTLSWAGKKHGANRRKDERMKKKENTRSKQAKKKCGRKDWMKIISNYLEEGIGEVKESGSDRAVQQDGGDWPEKTGCHLHDGFRRSVRVAKTWRERRKMLALSSSSKADRIGMDRLVNPFQCARSVRLLFVYFSGQNHDWKQ